MSHFLVSSWPQAFFYFRTSVRSFLVRLCFHVTLSAQLDFIPIRTVARFFVEVSTTAFPSVAIFFLVSLIFGPRNVAIKRSG